MEGAQGGKGASDEKKKAYKKKEKRELDSLGGRSGAERVTAYHQVRKKVIKGRWYRHKKKITKFEKGNFGVQESAVT